MSCYTKHWRTEGELHAHKHTLLKRRCVPSQTGVSYTYSKKFVSFLPFKTKTQTHTHTHTHYYTHNTHTTHKRVVGIFYFTSWTEGAWTWGSKISFWQFIIGLCLNILTNFLTTHLHDTHRQDPQFPCHNWERIADDLLRGQRQI